MKPSKMSNVIAEEYASSLSDLTVNSKPLINMLTMLAEENHDHAPAIVAAVEKHLQKVPSDIKLPVLYLIDSIVKNVGRSYITLFTQNIVSTFCSCFEKVDERTRGQMFKLRQTWNEVFPAKKLYAVDVRVSSVDPAWPITAPPPTSIHVNPKFFAKPAPTAPESTAAALARPPVAAPAPEQDAQTVSEVQMRDELLKKQKELIELQQRKLTLELMQTKAKLEEQQKQLDRQTSIVHSSQPLFQPALQASNETAAQILAVQKIIEAATLQLPDLNKVATQVRPVTTLQPTSASTNASASIKTKAPTSPPKTTVRSRDPRLAVRNLQNIVPQVEPVMNAVQLIEPAKSKQPITDNLGCNVPNKEPRGITKPRIITAKVRNTSKVSPTSNAGIKAPEISKTKVASPITSFPTTMKKIPRLKDSSKIVKIDLTSSSSPSPKKGETVGIDKESINLKKLSPKLDSPKKKSSAEKDKSNVRLKVNENKMSTVKPDSPRKKASDSKSVDIAITMKRVKMGGKSSERPRDRSKYDVDSDRDSQSPPPPPNISDAKKLEERAKFRDVKISAKGRNYVRRNRRDESRSRSPVKSDVDLRLNGPPEKQPKLMPSADIAQKHNVDGLSVDAAKDVDLRQLPGARTSSPNKKRLSSEREIRDQPPTKKSKAEMFDVLFGNEDVDLRCIGTAPNVTRQPSPPPPPIISHHSPTMSPTSSPRQDSSSLSPKQDSKKSIKGKSGDDHVKGNGEVKPRDWAKFKGPKSPISSSPYRDRRRHETTQGKLDRLGRPLLFHRLSDGRSSDRRRYPSLSEDTDMRMYVNEDSLDDVDGNINIIVSQAEEQLKSGQLSFPQYNTLIKQVIQLNEAKKLREAQRRDENWEQRNVRSHRMDLSPVSDDSSLCDRSAEFSTCGDTSDTAHRVIDQSHRRVGDIDDRYSAPRNMGRSGWPSWELRPPPQPWIHGPPRQMQPSQQQHQRPPFLRPPGGDVRWRQPHPPFINRMQGPPPPFDPPPHPIPRFEHFPVTRPDTFDSRGPPPPAATTALPTTSGGHQELPPADPVVLDLIAQDSMRTISIDGCPREIRYYGDTALTMLAWDDPREVLFQRGTRRIVFDDRVSIMCSLNDTYRDYNIDGEPHKIRFGAPTREIYIDGKWYECYFGGPPISIEIGGKTRTVKLEGPPPQVKLGFAKRTDLCAGKINLIVNAMTMVPVFLDAKPQRIDIENKPHILRFINALTTLLINGRPFNVEFGGLPKPIVVHAKKHFIRFSVLPRGIRPGYISIRNMEGGRLPSPPRGDHNISNGLMDAGDNTIGMQPSMPQFGDHSVCQSFNRDSHNESTSPRDSPNLFDDEEVMPMTGVYINHNIIGGQMPLDMLTSLMPSTLAPSSGFGYQVEPESHSQDGTTKPTEEATPTPASEPITAAGVVSAGVSSLLSFLPPNINVDELFQKLVATGIVPTGQEDGAKEPSPGKPAVEIVEPKKEEPRTARHVDLKIPETLRVRQPGLVAILYSGIQCSSCGVRFPPEETVKYSQHLDWHFRQNRRERDNTRKAQSRKWYYDVSDWIQFEEIEDLEHRAQSWFDVQLEATSGVEDAEPVEIPSVSVGVNSEDPFCVMCHDKFEQFYNEESEEWHLKLAIRVEDKIYHPLCYEDFKTAILEESLAEVKEEVKVAIDDEKAQDEPAADSSVVVKDEEDEKQQVDMEVAEVEVKIEVESESMVTSQEVDILTEDLTSVEETGEPGQSEAELVVGTLLDDVLETIELQLFGPRIVKLEPIDGEPNGSDSTDATIIVSEIATKAIAPAADTTHAAVVSSIDGNVQFEDKPQTGVAQAGSKIKINITKPITARESQNEPDEEASLTESEIGCGLTPMERSEDTEPPPPGVETVPESAKLKPKLVGRTLTALPPVTKGTDLTGLCSIM